LSFFEDFLEEEEVEDGEEGEEESDLKLPESSSSLIRLKHSLASSMRSVCFIHNELSSCQRIEILFINKNLATTDSRSRPSNDCYRDEEDGKGIPIAFCIDFAALS